MLFSVFPLIYIFGEAVIDGNLGSHSKCFDSNKTTMKSANEEQTKTKIWLKKLRNQVIGEHAYVDTKVYIPEHRKIAGHSPKGNLH